MSSRVAQVAPVVAGCCDSRANERVSETVALSFYVKLNFLPREFYLTLVIN